MQQAQLDHVTGAPISWLWAHAYVATHPRAFYLVSAFQGCYDFCQFDLTDLPSYHQQKRIFLAALNADYPRRRMFRARREAARELVRQAVEQGWDWQLKGEWAKLA